MENAAIHEFYLSHSNYGTRKLKIQPSRKQNEHGACKVSRRRIRYIMDRYGLVSKYTLKHSKKHKGTVNEGPIPNKVERRFSGRKPLEVVVSDLTYIC
ncbi:hypothetical protein LQZ18_00585 [Lachnospiraceae bacterium ZAX-1]